MEYNKKEIIILASITVSLAIIGIISTFLLIKHQRNIKTAETSTLSEFKDENNNIDENVKESENENNDENNSENEIKEEQNKEDIQPEKNNNKNNTTNDGNYYIKVNLQANVVTIYKKDEEGKFTEPVKAMVCSTGTATPTSGVYSTTNKYEWRLLIGNVYGQYATRIVGSILFHSVPYTKKDPSALEYWEYDKLGTKASAGCIRLTVKDAKWIYDNCKSGTKVEFYSDSNPGPLGKPTAQKISNVDESIRIWDPTDPKSNNPWKTYNPNKEENKPIEENKEDNKENNKENTIKNSTGNTTQKPTENTTIENITNNITNNTVNNTTTENKPIKDENNSTQTENKTEGNTINSTQTENKI